MTEDRTPIPIDQQLDAYHDDRLTPERRAEFEHRLDANPTLREQLDLQLRIDDTLIKTFQPQSHTASNARRTRTTRDYLIAIAAVIVIVASASLVYRHLFSSPNSDSTPRLSMQRFYDKAIASGFQPGWVCETDDEFAQTFENRFGVPMLARNLPDDVQLLGLGYGHVLTRYTIVVFARVQGQPVMLFVDRIAPPASLPRVKSGFNRFHRELDGIQIYELTPLDQPRLIDYLNPINRNDEAP